MVKMCVLENKVCIDCGQCNYCDLDANKICDNCCKCMGDAEYRALEIDAILLDVDK